MIIQLPGTGRVVVLVLGHKQCEQPVSYFAHFNNALTSDFRGESSPTFIVLSTLAVVQPIYTYTQIMAQGLAKVAKARKQSGGAQKRKNAKVVSKGRKTYNPKGRKAVEFKEDNETSKALARKTEAYVSAKAIARGSRFFLSDVKEVGKKELNVQEKLRNKKEEKEKKMDQRLKEQLRKLGREV